MPTLDTSIANLPGIGEKKAAAFRKLGIYTYGDMISYFPRRYDDRSHMVPIAMAVPEDTCCVQAMVATVPTHTRVRRGMELVKLRIADDSGVMDVTYFNQPYVKNALQMGETYNFYGKVTAIGSRKQMTNPVFEKAENPRVTGRIIPVYRSTALLSQKVMVSAAERCLADCGHMMPDLLRSPVGTISVKRSSPTALCISPRICCLWTSPVGVWCSRSCLCWPAPLSCCTATAPQQRVCGCSHAT